MAGTMVADRGYLPEKTRYFLIAHEDLIRGRVVEIDLSASSIGADSGLPEDTKDAVAAAATVSSGILGVAETAANAGDRVWIVTKGLVFCSVAASAAVGVALSLDDSDIERLDDALHAIDEVVKIVGYAQTAVGGSDGEVLVFFNGEEGYGTMHAAIT